MSSQKVISISALKKKIPGLRRTKKIAFTNGCFDVLHYGHISYLEKAKGKGRVLIIGLNSDRSVKRLKGKDRPVVNQKHRARILAALECVDYVIIFNEPTPQKLIEQIKPDLLIKGSDWKGKEVAGAAFVKSYGGDRKSVV